MYEEVEFQVSQAYLVSFTSYKFFTHLCHCISFIEVTRNGEEDALLYLLDKWWLWYRKGGIDLSQYTRTHYIYTTSKNILGRGII